ncbi:hypothetical protein H8959_018489 [Pygathrix nigripes]
MLNTDLIPLCALFPALAVMELTSSECGPEFSGSFNGRREPRRGPRIHSKMIITTWIVYILARKGVGLPFLPITSSDIDVVESEAVSVLQHWLKKTEEEASQGIKEKLSLNYPSQSIREKMSTDSPPTHGQDVHVTRDVVKHHLFKSDMSANQSQEVLEERTRIQFIRWSHTRIFQVPSEMTEDIMRDRIEQVRRRWKSFRVQQQLVSEEHPSLLDLKKGQTWAERLQQVSSSCDNVSTGVFLLNCE